MRLSQIVLYIVKESPVSKDFIYDGAKNLRAAFSAARKVIFYTVFTICFYALISNLNEADSPLTGSVTVTTCSSPTLV